MQCLSKSKPQPPATAQPSESDLQRWIAEADILACKR